MLILLINFSRFKILRSYGISKFSKRHLSEMYIYPSDHRINDNLRNILLSLLHLCNIFIMWCIWIYNKCITFLFKFNLFKTKNELNSFVFTFIIVKHNNNALDLNYMCSHIIIIRKLSSFMLSKHFFITKCIG